MNKEEVKSFNAHLDSLQTKIYQAHRRLREADWDITLESIRDEFVGKKEKSMSVIDIFKDHNQKMGCSGLNPPASINKHLPCTNIVIIGRTREFGDPQITIRICNTCLWSGATKRRTRCHKHI